jgi:Ca2+/Na+ antiporter
MDFYQLLGYFTGLAFIRPDMEPSSLLRTALLVHALDAVLCGVIANHSRRNQIGWTLGGLVCGIWALGILFLLPAKK